MTPNEIVSAILQFSAIVLSWPVSVFAIIAFLSWHHAEAIDNWIAGMEVEHGKTKISSNSSMQMAQLHLPTPNETVGNAPATVDLKPQVVELEPSPSSTKVLPKPVLASENPTEPKHGFEGPRVESQLNNAVRRDYARLEKFTVSRTKAILYWLVGKGPSVTEVKDVIDSVSPNVAEAQAVWSHLVLEGLIDIIDSDGIGEVFLTDRAVRYQRWRRECQFEPPIPICWAVHLGLKYEDPLELENAVSPTLASKIRAGAAQCP